MNPQTGDIENLEILFFSKRLAENRLELPVSAGLARSNVYSKTIEGVWGVLKRGCGPKRTPDLA